MLKFLCTAVMQSLAQRMIVSDSLWFMQVIESSFVQLYKADADVAQ